MLPPRLPLGATSVLLLAWSNLVVPRLPPAIGVRTVANLGATGVLLLGAHRAGVTTAELGVGRPTWRAGARWGGAALGVATAAYLIGLALPAGRTALAGSAPACGTAGELAVRTLVHIPLGTVLCEEAAFRGVLLAVADRQLPPRPAHALTAAVFGLWHVGTARSDARTGASVAGTVVATGVGGAVLGWLRARSGSLLAPVGLHLGTNSVGLLAAAVARSRSASRPGPGPHGQSTHSSSPSVKSCRFQIGRRFFTSSTSSAQAANA